MLVPFYYGGNMNFYTNAKQYGSVVLVRGIKDGKRYIDKVKFQPTLYHDSTKKTDYKSLENKYVQPVKFDSINAARDYINRYKDVHNFEIYGNTAYNFQWISEIYPGKFEYDTSLIKIVSYDIETTVGSRLYDKSHKIVVRKKQKV